MKHRPIVFLDIETTGGKPSESRVVDIGAIRVEDGKIVSTFNQLLNPELPIPRFITDLTGITNDMTWTAPKFSTVATELEDFLSGALFTAHHVEFDYGFIKAEFKRIGVQFDSDRACTVKLSRILHHNESGHGLDMIIRRMNYKVVNRHRGYDDAEVLWKYFSDNYADDPYRTLRALQQVTVSCRKKKIMSNQTALLDLLPHEQN